MTMSNNTPNASSGSSEGSPRDAAPSTSMRIWPPTPPHLAGQGQSVASDSESSSPSGQTGPSDQGGTAAAGSASGLSLEARVIEAIREVYDPEIPVNIYDLGLVYELNLDQAKRSADITMTLTTPNCPEAEKIPLSVRQAAESVEGIDHATVKLVWSPPWDKSRMSEDAKLLLGLD